MLLQACHYTVAVEAVRGEQYRTLKTSKVRYAFFNLEVIMVKSRQVEQTAFEIARFRGSYFLVPGYFRTGVLTTKLVLILGCIGLIGCDRDERKENVAGNPESTETEVLKAGAALFQSDNPLEPMNIYLVGFHPSRDDPSHQMEAHHFCEQFNEDFAQCVLFNSNKKGAKLNGIEYIISEQLFINLPEEEKQYWHPHNGEILSGQLVAPGLPAAAEHELMEKKMNSYGKTWHTWPGSNPESSDSLPYGEPTLAWSFNRDGELNPQLIEKRDKHLDINTQEIRKSRTDLLPLAKPQAGVDLLKGKFPGATQDMAGVVDLSAAPPGSPEPAVPQSPGIPGASADPGDPGEPTEGAGTPDAPMAPDAGTPPAAP